MKKSQIQLVQSYAGRALAIKIVSTNKGKSTAGVDGKLYQTPTEKLAAISLLRTEVQNLKNYQGSPVKRIWIKKDGTNEKRPLGIPTISDRALQTLFSLALDPAVEVISDDNSYGFRPRRSTHDAIAKASHFFLPRMKKRTLNDATWSHHVWEADISKCFDTIDHDFLLTQLNELIFDVRPFAQWLTSEIWDKGNTIKPQAGTPQGGAISSLLCNIALNGLEDIVKSKTKTFQERKKANLIGVHIVRYADDFIVTCRDKNQIVEVVKQIEDFLKIRGMRINTNKTKFRSMKDSGFVFLGWSLKLKPWSPKLNNETSENRTGWVLIVNPSRKSNRKIRRQIDKIYSKHSSSLWFRNWIRSLLVDAIIIALKCIQEKPSKN